jgi:hypothetical protein
MNQAWKSLILLCVGILVAVGILLNVKPDSLQPSIDGIGDTEITRKIPGTSALEEGQTPGESPAESSMAHRLVRTLLATLSTLLNTTLMLAVAAVILVGAVLGRAISRGVRMPAQVTVVPMGALPDGASDYVEATTKSLESLGFSSQLDFTMPEIPHEGFYRLMASSRGRHTALISEIMAPGLSEPARYVEFQTLLENGAKINTNNNPLPTPFIPPPHVFVETYPDLMDVSALYDRHNRNEEEVAQKDPGPVKLQRVEDFPARMRNDWREVIEYQAACGLLEKNPHGDDYYGTSRLFLRYLWTSLTAMLPRSRQ